MFVTSRDAFESKFVVAPRRRSSAEDAAGFVVAGGGFLFDGFFAITFSSDAGLAASMAAAIRSERKTKPCSASSAMIDEPTALTANETAIDSIRGRTETATRRQGSREAQQ